MDRGARHGATIDLTHWRDVPTRALLFGEAQARAVVTTTRVDALLAIAKKHGVPAQVIGKVGALEAPLEIVTPTVRLNAPLSTLDDAYHEAIPRIMSQSAAASPS
jgi:phosphoribosylformylglycinamidine synthase